MSDESINPNPGQSPKSKKRIWDKLIMGAVIGGAIGSVLGATIAPKKGAETRKDIIEAVKKSQKSSKVFFSRFKKMFSFGKKNKAAKEETITNPSPGHSPHGSIQKIPTEQGNHPVQKP